MIKILDRLLLFFYSIVIGAVAVFTLLYATNVMDRSLLMDTELWLDNVVTAAAAVIILISLRFFYISIRRDRTNHQSIDLRNEHGDIHISMETIENLALKAASRARGVKDLKVKIRVSEAGLELIVRTFVDGDTSIPELTEEVQRQVREHVTEVTGIPVATVSVFIANIVQSQSFKSRVE
ncbi:alkaline shock response membrane anchor protein AmaP [Paenibacillus guangzhouensis]|uniref:alkaline shock response membrane anchor protein AmaP n=1 Tax=Paenibacillus guangzhouensis TaxID=1473112 RepID=UPI0012669FF7|nr:alkaline shock response membrane anchor protein AmaP [Paenibacillus guangzhouensis]